MRKHKIKSLMMGLIGLMVISPANAETLKEALVRINNEHPLIRVVNNNIGAANEDIGKNESALYPRINIVSKAGYQDIYRDNGLSGTFHPNEIHFGVNQLIWDFGLTQNNIIHARKNLDKEVLERAAQCANLMLAGIEAYLGLGKQQQLVKFAKQSEENIKRQAQLENTRIENGKGYTTDLLQAKNQLSSAKARRVAAEGELKKAVSRYESVFGAASVPDGELLNLEQPTRALPATLEQVLSLVDVANYNVLAANGRSALIQASRDAVVSKERMPRIDVQADHIRRHDLDGTVGGRVDNQVILQFSWNYDVGQKARYVAGSSAYLVESEKQKGDYVIRQSQEQARNAWSDLETSRLRIEYLRDQVDISKKFLDLARKERELGRRTLLDVLDGETNLINAQAGLAAAEHDIVLATYKVLHAIGNLDINLIRYANSPSTAELISPTALVVAGVVSTTVRPPPRQF